MSSTELCPDNKKRKIANETTEISAADKNPDNPENNTNTTQPKKKRGNVKFPYGNYIAYYGYRYDHKGPLAYDKSFIDPRLQAIHKKAGKYFKNKDVLDIGCNTGHVTLHIAKNFEPRKIVGCDIDDNLIDIARKNINHYLEGRETAIQPKTKTSQESDASVAKSSGLISKNPDIDAPLTTDKPPLSFTSQRGNILPPVLHPIRPDGIFPNNILFFSGDYCPKTDDHVLDQTPEYDTILCLSVTKWVHLNNHDEGLLRLFQRIYRALRTGGYFILEPQGWGSYNKKKRSFPEYLRGNLKELKLRPDMFEKILVEQIGFKDNVVKVTPNFIDKHKKTNFERDIFIFEK